MDAKTQTAKIKHYMETHDGITSQEAFRKFNITRLSARIWDLIHQGVKVEKITETSTNEDGETSRYTRYYIKKEN